MTENELRSKVAGTVMGWVGGVRGGPEHLEVLEIYNSQRPLPRGYRVKTTDAYCAATVSADWIKNGVAPYTGTECSCNELIALAKERGIWVEDDSYVPKVGDAVVYDWQDGGVGDNMGVADHIGIFVALNGDVMTVAEGNTSGGRIGTREIKVNGRYIRGFICPDYAKIAADMTLAEAPAEASSWAREAAEKAVARGIIKGYGNGDFGWRENVTREELAVMLDRLGVL